MTSYEQALRTLRAAIAPLPLTRMAVDRAAGCATAAAVASPVAVPGFDNAAMDGYALRAAETARAADGNPLQLPVRGSVAAGQAAAPAPAGGAVEIMTGAPVPEGLDAVVPVERVARGNGRIELRQPVGAGANVRRAGEDFAPGDRVLPAARIIDAPAVIALAACGIAELDVRTPPRIALLITGEELATDAPADAAVHDANGPYLRAALAERAIPLTGSHHAGDEPAALRGAFAAAMEDAKIIISTGGVSAGRHDHVPQAVRDLGGEILFHGVALRPGKPVLCARMPGDRWLFGLPGNPVAVAACLRLVVMPAVDALMGLPPERPLKARAASAIRKKPGMTFCGKARVHAPDAGALEVALLPGQESFRVRPLAEANCWLMVAGDRDEVEAGEPLDILPLVRRTFF